MVFAKSAVRDGRRGAGKNNTIVKGKQRQSQTPQRSASKATHAEVQELLSVAARELEPWQDGVTLEMVERLYCVPEATDTMRIQARPSHRFANICATSGWSLSSQTYHFTPKAHYSEKL